MLAYDEQAAQPDDDAGRDWGRRSHDGGWPLEMAAIRRHGVALDREETFAGISCAGVPIRNSGRAIAAVSVTGTTSALRLELVVPALTSAAESIWTSLFDRNRLTVSA